MKEKKILLIIFGILFIINSGIMAGGKSEQYTILSKEVPELTLSAGELAGYSYEHHVSVGYHGEYEIADTSVLEFVEERVKYEHPSGIRQNTTGSDGAEGTFIFRGKKPGITELTVYHMFRGDVEETVIITITVK